VEIVLLFVTIGVMSRLVQGSAPITVVHPTQTAEQR
jgi:hypothetical protein